MSKPYWSGQGGRTGSSYIDDDSLGNHDSPTYRTGGYDSGTSGAGFYSNGGYRTTDEYRAADYESYDDYDDDDIYEYYEGPDRRWRWLAGLAVAVLLAAVLVIVTVIRSDETTPTAQTGTIPPATSTTPRTVVATVPPSPAPPPQAQLAPETVVTITTTPSALPTPVAAPPPAVAVPPPVAAPGTRTVTYTVTGTRQLIDLVTIIYTDEQGLPRTDINATLPWTKTLALDPGVDFESVTATSVTGQLNCAITDEAGATLIAQNNNSMIATCTS